MNMPQENNLIITILQGATLGKRKPRGRWSDNVIEGIGIFFREHNPDIRREMVRYSAAQRSYNHIRSWRWWWLLVQMLKCSLSSLSTKVSCQWRDLLKISGDGTENREEWIPCHKSIKLHQKYNIAIVLSVSSWECVRDLYLCIYLRCIHILPIHLLFRLFYVSEMRVKIFFSISIGHCIVTKCICIFI